MSNDRWLGVALPWGPDIRSFIEPKDDNHILQSSVLWILLTRKGERCMLPEFGSDIPGSVFEPNDDILVAGLQASVREAIERWDDRIELVLFETERDENSLMIKLGWRNLKDPTSEGVFETTLRVTPEEIIIM